MSEPLHLVTKGRHTCSVCKKTTNFWDRDGWIWYGSIKDMDDGTRILKFCGWTCAKQAKVKGLIPRNARNPEMEL